MCNYMLTTTANSTALLWFYFRSYIISCELVVKGSPVIASRLKTGRRSEAFDVVVRPFMSLLVSARASLHSLAAQRPPHLSIHRTAHLATGRVRWKPRARHRCDQSGLLVFHVCRQLAFQAAAVGYFQAGL